MKEGGRSGPAIHSGVAAHAFHFGPYRFDPRERLLYENSREVELPPRALMVLEHLLRRSGHIVPKNELLGLWGDTAVSEQSLSEAIRLIRKELGDTAGRPKYIQTLRKRGYRFIAPVAVEGPGAPARRSPGAPAGRGPAVAIGGHSEAGVAAASRFPTAADAGHGFRFIGLSRRWQLAGMLAVALSAVLWFLLGVDSRTNQDLIQGFEQQNNAMVELGSRLTHLENEAALGSALQIREVWAEENTDNFFSAPSPDGRYLSFVDWGTGDLALYEISTGDARRLTHNEEPYSAGFSMWSIFSPDGIQIAYHWKPNEGPVELRIVDMAGSSPRLLCCANRTEILPVGEIVPVGWSSDGREILVLFTEEGGTQRLVFVSVVDDSVRLVASFPDNLHRPLSLSPDGRFIAYDLPPSPGEQQRDIFLISSTGGGKVTTLVEHLANDRSPIWTPDGTGVLFLSDRTGTTGAWFLPVLDGLPQGRPQLVTLGLGEDIYPLGLSRNGSYFFGTDGTWDIYITSVDLASGRVLGEPRMVSLSPEGQNVEPVWSPDGEHLAFVSGRDSLSILDVETGGITPLRPELLSILQPRWAADSLSIYVVGGDRFGRWGYYEVDARSEQVTPLLQAPPWESWYNWHKFKGVSPDERELFYVQLGAPRAGTGKLRHLLAQDLETGAERELLNGPGPGRGGIAWLTMKLSPDGRRLAFIDHGERALKVMGVFGGRPRELLSWSSEPEDDVVLWDWAPDGILYTRRQAEAPDRTLWIISPEGGAPWPIELELKGVREFRLSPDGSRIAFSQSSGGHTVWVMENFLAHR